MQLDNSALLKATGVGAAVVLVLTLLSQIPLLGLVFCCVLWLGYVGIGALYGVFARRGGAMFSAGPLALGGAIAAGLSGIVQGIISSIISLAFTSEAAVAEALAQLEAQGMEVPPEMLELYTGTGFGIASALFAICFSFFIAAILGAIGGAIYGATQRSAAPPPSSYPPSSPGAGPRIYDAPDTTPDTGPEDPWQ